MTLTICDKTYGDIESGFYVAAKLLKEPGAHLFIASNHWDTVIIRNLEEIPQLKVNTLCSVSDRILVELPEVITGDTMRTLTHLFPEKAGSIRKCYLTRGDMQEVLRDCLV